MTTAEQQEAKQSRVGKRPVVIPKGVELSFDESKVSLKGPKGALERPVPPYVKLSKEGDTLVVGLDPKAGLDAKQYQGLARALLASWVAGVAEGYKKSLDLHGVGYRAELKGSELTLNVGLSHQVQYSVPDGVNCNVEVIDSGGTKRPRIHLDSCDKELLGQTAARIRSFRPPEPYKGKGIRYMGERIRTKAGKAGGKG